MAASGSSRSRTSYGDPRASQQRTRTAEQQTQSGGLGGFFRNLGNNISDIWSDIKIVFRDPEQKLDLSLLLLILILVSVGTVMMYSASYAYAYLDEDINDSLYYLKKQVGFALTGVVGMYFVSLVPAQHLKRMTWWMLILSYLLLGVVYLAPAVNDAHRWIFGFQPSEFTKFVMILFCATWADTHAKKMHTFKEGILPFLVIGGSTALLIFFEPHVSCTIIILLLGVTMMVVGGIDMRWIISIVVIAAVAIAAIMIFREQLIEVYPFSRIYARVDILVDPFKDTQNSGWQTIQGLYAISSGGLFGQGIGNSHQKYLYISEPQNDFIFAVICEELGFVGAVAVILLFIVFIWRGFAISLGNTSRFCKLLGVGITSQVAWQALLNMMVVTNLMPNTGISLPFFSYGGTSLVMLLLEMGVLLSISRRSPVKKV